MKNIIYEDQIAPIELPGRTLKWLFTPENNSSQNFSLNVVVIKPGSTVKPAHAHLNHEEVIYIISGNGKAYIDGNVFEIREGTSILFEKGSIHMLRNSGSEMLKVVCYFTPEATLKDYTFYEDIVFPD